MLLTPMRFPPAARSFGNTLAPLAALPEIAGNLKLGAMVTAITRHGLDKVSSSGRDKAPFVVRYTDEDGEHRLLARAVIDASGTWTQPNPIGIDGLAVPGEALASERIAYGIPDVVGELRGDYAGKRILVIGAGHSAINVALALMELQDEAPSTEIFWALRSNSVDKLLGGGLNDQLPERGALGLAAKAAMDNGRLKMLAPFAAERVTRDGDRVRVSASLAGKPFDASRRPCRGYDRVSARLLVPRELRIEVDPAVEAPPALSPLIDPNFHSCGDVPPHGIAELAHPEPDFTIVGSKSYGRAPTFLMATGYEQVRSVVAAIAGDHVAAREVQLVLPKTGVCSADPITGPVGEVAAGCCGGPAPASVDACCVADAKAKDRGQDRMWLWQHCVVQSQRRWKLPNERRRRLLRPRYGRSVSPRSSATGRSSTATASSRQPSRRSSPGRRNGYLRSSRHRCWRARSLRHLPAAGPTNSAQAA